MTSYFQPLLQLEIPRMRIAASLLMGVVRRMCSLVPRQQGPFPAFQYCTLKSEGANMEKLGMGLGYYNIAEQHNVLHKTIVIKLMHIPRKIHHGDDEAIFCWF